MAPGGLSYCARVIEAMTFATDVVKKIIQILFVVCYSSACMKCESLFFKFSNDHSCSRTDTRGSDMISERHNDVLQIELNYESDD